MLNVTFYHVEQLAQPELGWKRIQSNGSMTDKSQAEKLLQEEKAHWDQYMAESEQEAGDDEAFRAHIKRLQEVGAWRIVEEVKTFTHASLYRFSDVEAFEIVKVISDQTLEVRPMKTSHSIAGLEFTPGGFFGHVHNQEKQKVTYESDPEAGTLRIRRKKGSADLWGHKGDTFRLKTEPRAFYDYNF